GDLILFSGLSEGKEKLVSFDLVIKAVGVGVPYPPITIQADPVPMEVIEANGAPFSASLIPGPDAGKEVSGRGGVGLVFRREKPEPAQKKPCGQEHFVPFFHRLDSLVPPVGHLWRRLYDKREQAEHKRRRVRFQSGFSGGGRAVFREA